MYRFLGSIPFALILICLTALFVIAGTVLESSSGSHLFAARLTYDSPLFASLLLGFFINILVSALHRWPFKRRHIPFLITHLGLLMVLSGAIIKNKYGIQGVMRLAEGTGSHEILLPHTYALLLEPREDPSKKMVLPIGVKGPLNIEMIRMIPHATEKRETWVKEGLLAISGLPTMAFDGKEVKAHLIPESTPWAVVALKSDDPEETMRKAYLQGLKVLADDQDFDLDWNTLILTYKGVQIHLSGPNSLINPIQIDLVRDPTLLFVHDGSELTVALFDAHGRVHRQKVDSHNLVAYDRGFGGYAVQLKLPFYKVDRAKIEKEKRGLLAHQLKGIKPQQLSPPLHLIYRACQESGLDFASSTIAFLDSWDRSESWLFPADGKLYPEMEAMIACLDWKSLPKTDLRSSLWVVKLADYLEPELKNGKDILHLMQHWPLIADLKEEKGGEGPCTSEETARILARLCHHLVALDKRLPPADIKAKSGSQLLSAFMRLYGLHLSSLAYPEIKEEFLTLETPLRVKYEEAPLPAKVEDHRPVAIFKAPSQVFSIAYDPFAADLKWPLFGGAYRMRFQPEIKSIPSHIRLKNARQISYAGSNQPYSFESDITVRSLRSGEEKDVTLSMNCVYESEEGYRFYLSHIAPPEEGSLKQIQLVVNRDPAKYWLTYPGGVVLSLGIVLLFLQNRKK